MENIPNLKPSEIQPYMLVLEQIKDTGLLEQFDVDINARMSDVAQRARQMAEAFYETKMQELQAAPGVNRALPMLFMSDEIEKAAKLLDKRFPTPLLE